MPKLIHIMDTTDMEDTTGPMDTDGEDGTEKDQPMPNQQLMLMLVLMLMLGMDTTDLMVIMPTTDHMDTDIGMERDLLMLNQPK